MCAPELTFKWQLGHKDKREFQDKIPFEIEGIRYQIILTFPVPLFIVQLIS